MTSSSVAERIKRLEEAQIIKQYTVQIETSFIVSSFLNNQNIDVSKLSEEKS